MLPYFLSCMKLTYVFGSESISLSRVDEKLNWENPIYGSFLWNLLGYYLNRFSSVVLCELDGEVSGESGYCLLYDDVLELQRRWICRWDCCRKFRWAISCSWKEITLFHFLHHSFCRRYRSIDDAKHISLIFFFDF